MVAPTAAPETARRTSAEPDSGSALGRLVGDRDAFASRHWGRTAFHRPAGPGSGQGSGPGLGPGSGLGPGQNGADADTGVHARFQDLLTEADVDELIATRGLRAPFLRVAKGGSTLADRAFTAGGGIGALIGDQVSDDKLQALFADGATIVLQGLHRTWPPLLEFTQELAADLGHPVQCNAYITPPQSQGFSAHYDVHDVFVLQLFGEKRWRIHAPVLRDPLRDQVWNDRKDAVEAAAAAPPEIDVVLRPGDCLYLPRGYLHSAVALGEVSGHLTIGVHVWTEHAVASTLMTRALASLSGNDEVRRTLPLGLDVTSAAELEDPVERARAALIAAVRAVPAAQIATALAQQARGAQRAAPIGPLAQTAAARNLTAETPVRLRDHLMPRGTPTDDGSLRLTSRAGTVTVPVAEAAALAALLEGGTLRADTLARQCDMPLDDAFALVRRLLGARVLVVQDDDNPDR